MPHAYASGLLTTAEIDAGCDLFWLDKEAWRSVLDRNKEGLTTDEDPRPRSFDIGRPVEWMPRAARASGFPIVDGGIAGILREYNLGRTVLESVMTHVSDDTTAFPGDWHCLYVRERYETIDFERTKRGLLDAWRHTPPHFHMAVRRDDQICVSTPVQHDLDLWIDPRVIGGLMLSRRLGDRLRAEGVGTDMEIFSCAE
jgi:hypothetical protein